MGICKSFREELEVAMCCERMTVRLCLVVLGVTVLSALAWAARPSSADEERPKVQTTYTSMEMETPHVKWARPYHAGKVKAIIFKGGIYQRGIIELAQRMDLDFDTTYLSTGRGTTAISDYYGITTKADLKAGLERLFKDNPDWEVLVIPGPMFRLFSKEQQKAVLKKVKTGSGLVLIDPDDAPTLETLSPLQNRGQTVWGPWVKENDHFITNGIPFSALPPTETYDYDLADGAQVLVSSQGKPLAVVSRYGQGRIVALAYWAGYGKKRGTNFCSLVPHMSRMGKDLAPQPPTFKYYEYHFSMLSKAVLWAAKKEPKLLIKKMACGPLSARAVPTGIRLNLDNQGKQLRATLLLRASDK